MTINQFNIVDSANQYLSTVMNEQRVTFRFWFNRVVGRWSFDVSIDDVPVVTGRRLTMGIDLLEAFNHDLGEMQVFAVKEGLLPDYQNLIDERVMILSFDEGDLVT